MLIHAMRMVAQFSASECLETYEVTTDNLVKSVCGWRLLSPEDFSRLLVLVETPVDVRAAAASDPALTRPAISVQRRRHAGEGVRSRLLLALSERERWPTTDLAVRCVCLPATVRVVVCDLRKEGHAIGGPTGGGYYLSSKTEPIHKEEVGRGLAP